MPVTPAECRVFFDALQKARPSSGRSPPITLIFCLASASRILSMRWISAAAGKSGWRTITGSTRSIRSRGKVPVDFGALFAKIEGLGYEGHYTNGFGTIDDMLAGRDYMLARAQEAGVEIG